MMQSAYQRRERWCQIERPSRSQRRARVGGNSGGEPLDSTPCQNVLRTREKVHPQSVQPILIQGSPRMPIEFYDNKEPILTDDDDCLVEIERVYCLDWHEFDDAYWKELER